MCQVYADVTFCTCSDFEIDQVQSLKNYWVLYRFNEALDLVIVGEIMLDDMFKKYNPNNLVELVLKKLNNNTLFDKSIDFEDKDRLHVSIELNQVNLNYGFEYEANSWSEIEYDYFTWANSYEEKNGGEVKLYELL
ncbi:hypothetical protein [Empedobacter falsenii]|uniref:Uncharacterized protein n=1 Tax=Empedobacter falsenii TaxID=343874 RepID=A0A3R8TMU8_9FLAO|nr:hypothetical protein [Empedobacter falsenii]RRT86557.1 hypothetical protein EGI88_14310 [Empedobacter falsenii]RRT87892.1 hypothetical protein EGI89_14375 [Empedobacter falsenii]